MKLHCISETYVSTNPALFGRSLPLIQKKPSDSRKKPSNSWKKPFDLWHSCTANAFWKNVLNVGVIFLTPIVLRLRSADLGYFMWLYYNYHSALFSCNEYVLLILSPLLSTIGFDSSSPGMKAISSLIRVMPLHELLIISFHLSWPSRSAAASLSRNGDHIWPQQSMHWQSAISDLWA